jgi:hypothetical protein
LLDLEKSDHKHKDLIKSGAIESFDEYFEVSKYKNEIIDFVEKQINCNSPKTRKIAADFLNKWK